MTDVSLLNLQQQLARLTADVQILDTLVNGDSTTTVTLTSGAVLPSLAKLINDSQNSVNTIITQLQTYLTDVTNQLYSQLQNSHITNYTVTNNTQNLVVTIPNLIIVSELSVNGIMQSASNYMVVGNVVTVPSSLGLNNGDIVTISYFTSI